MTTLTKSKKTTATKTNSKRTEVVPYVTKQAGGKSVSYDTISLSHETYEALHAAFDHFNRELFNGTLPQCVLTIRRKRGAHGLFSDNQFQVKDKPESLAEIALNPESFKRDELRAISTLVHEMVHLWQYRFGKPSRNGYHNKEWADAMELIGLMPSTTGEVGGHRTGQRVTHYIIEGGPYQQSFDRWPMRGKISWAGIVRESPQRSNSSKTKYQCDKCGDSVWGRPAMLSVCFGCKRFYCEKGKTQADYAEHYKAFQS